MTLRSRELALNEFSIQFNEVSLRLAVQGVFYIGAVVLIFEVVHGPETFAGIDPHEVQLLS